MPELKGVSIHPAQMYACVAHLLQFLLFVGLLGLISRDGVLTSLYLITHAIIRIFLERFRLDDRGKLGDKFTHTNLYSALQFIAGVGLLFIGGSSRGPIDWTGHMTTLLYSPVSISLMVVVFSAACLAFGVHYKSVGSWVDTKQVESGLRGPFQVGGVLGRYQADRIRPMARPQAERPPFRHL